MSLINPLETRNTKTGTLANSEDPDEILYNEAFHQVYTVCLDKNDIQ